MSKLTSTHPAGNDATVASIEHSGLLQGLADKLRSAWMQNDSLSLASYLEQHPDLCSDRSLVINLAVEEYRQKRDQGQLSNIGQYCEPFSGFGSALHSSIFRQIEVERYLDDHLDFRRAEQEIDWPSPGDQIAGYRLLEELGRGALARVYLCSQSTLGDRQVVVKVSRRGVQEGHTLGKLQHPNIMPIHSVELGNTQGLDFLCTPFLGRSTLHDVISIAFSNGIPARSSTILQAATVWSAPTDCVAEGRQSTADPKHRPYVDGIISLIAKLCDALAYAHESGIIHGDLKPSNILLTPTGEPLLLDFNLARDNELALDVRGGTLPYMAPEQIAQLMLDPMPEGSGCDERSEVFSLGVVLYELLSGHLPFDIDRDSETAAIGPKQLLNRQRQGPTPLTAHNPHVGSSLAAKVDCCLAYSQESRFKSMAELRMALLEELSPTRRFLRWSNVHRHLLVSFVFCTGLFLAGGSLWLINRPPYHLRQYQSGLTFQSAGELNAALEVFENSVAAEADFIDGKFAVARVNLAIGKVDVALKQFVQLATEYDHSASMACAGCCFNLSKSHSVAIPWYEKAVEAGYSTVGLHNNLAASYELGKTNRSISERIQLAQAHIELALKLNPASEVVRFNFARFELLRHLDDPQYVPTQGLEHINFVLNVCSDNPEGLLLAMQLYMAVAQTNPVIIDDAMDLLFEACKQGVGIDIDNFCTGPLGNVIQNHPRFSELRQMTSAQSDRHKNERFLRFIDPIENARERDRVFQN